MHICILFDAYEGSNSPLKEVDPPGDPRPYLKGHDCDLVSLKKSTAVQQIVALSKQGYDIFVNLCDGAWDEDRPGIEVVQALERLNLPFTGAGVNFYEPTREQMKLVCQSAGIRTPAFVMAERLADAEIALATLQFPMIVKHPNSYSSIGMTKDSRVTTPAALREQVARMITLYGATLIEEFIEGKEFTVLVSEDLAEPTGCRAYRPLEFRFPQGETFKHFNMKWHTYHDMMGVPVEDEELAERLKSMTLDLFMGLGGSGYGRTDIRMNAQGELFVLEMNPNCGIFYELESPGSADLILMNDPVGHDGFVQRLLDAGIERARRRELLWSQRLGSDGTFSIQARRDIKVGECVQSFENMPQTLVSQAEIERWPAARRALLAQTAYLVSPDLYSVWSTTTPNGKLFTHSAKPNTKLDGLRVVAVQPIAAGESITIDYRTLGVGDHPQQVATGSPTADTGFGNNTVTLQESKYRQAAFPAPGL